MLAWRPDGLLFAHPGFPRPNYGTSIPSVPLSIWQPPTHSPACITTITIIIINNGPACGAVLHGCSAKKPSHWISHKDPRRGATLIIFHRATRPSRNEWTLLLCSALCDWDVLMDKDRDSSCFPLFSKCLKPPAGRGNQAQLPQAQTAEQEAGWDAALAERKTTSCFWYV